jgi:3-oxoacyl-[acyl-carrier-protein] synthase II
VTSHITGIGLVTCLGGSARQTWDALIAGRYITDHARIDLKGGSRASHLAIRAAREAIASAASPSLPEAVIVGTSKGAVENWINWGSCEIGLGSIASDLARELGVAGPNLTISTACSSGLHALIRGAMMIEAGEASRVLVVATEASVDPLFIGSFERLGILPPPGFGCRPFDRSRRGFVMSEAAAAVILHAESSSQSVAVEKYQMAADAAHLTRNSDEARPLRHCLRQVAGDEEIDLIHAHGTGTEHNDATELAAFERVNGTGKPHVYSHKGALGHSLGAAGLVSVVLNVLSHRHALIPPNVQTRDPLPTTRLTICANPVHRSVRRSLAVAAGFGGQIAAVALVTSPPPASARR